MTWWMWAAVAAPGLLALVVVCLREPLRVTLPLFAAVIPFGGLLSVGDSPFGSASSLLGLLLAAGLLLQFTLNRPAAPTLPPTAPVWLLFVGLACATALWTVDRPATFSGLLVLGSLVLVYLLVALSPGDALAVRRTEDGLLAGGVVVVCYGLYQLFYLGGFPGDTPGAGIVAGGRFGNDMLGPGIEAVSLLLPFVLALSRAATASGPRTTAWRLLHLGVAALIFWGVLMTGSRTGTLAAGLVVLALAWSGPRQARAKLVGVFAVGLVVALAVWIYQPAGVASRSFESATSSSGRLEIWSVGLAACPEHCWYGSGWGTFSTVYAETQASVPNAKVLKGATGAYQAHNVWLLAAVELGVLGFVLLTWALVRGAAEAWRLPRAVRGPPFSALVGLVFAIFFLSSLEFKCFWMVFILIALNRNRVVSQPAGQQPGGARHATGLSTSRGGRRDG